MPTYLWMELGTCPSYPSFLMTKVQPANEQVVQLVLSIKVRKVDTRVEVGLKGKEPLGDFATGSCPSHLRLPSHLHLPFSLAASLLSSLLFSLVALSSHPLIKRQTMVR